uniref:Uncharacterized protein n=1 Tax=Arundo donax TaxID=35708 RepID=A0A0A9BX27_ARUDO
MVVSIVHCSLVLMLGGGTSLYCISLPCNKKQE